MKRLLFLSATAIAGASAQAFVIDDFSVTYFNTVQTGTWVDFQDGSMLSGERDVQFQVDANPFNQFSDLDITGAAAVFSSGFGVQATTYLQYDGTGDEINTGPGFVLTNGGKGAPILPGFNDRVRIAWAGNDLDVKVTVTARLNGAVLQTASAVRSANSGAGNMDIAMDSSNLGKMDSLTFAFGGVPNADFAITKLETVPEPTSLVVLTGAVALAVRRRRSGR